MAVAMCGLAIVAGAQTLPPTQPTSLPNQSPMTPRVAAPSAASDTLPHHRARVTYTDGLLQVRADNSSLNQILRDISRETGMKIIGGVADQRVFGSYGPAPASTVLQTLLDGTSTNMLLQETPDHAPKQLVLSPRTGGPTPPSPASSSYDITETEPELPLPPGTQPAPAKPAAAGTISASATSTSNATPPSSTPPVMPQPANNVLGNPNNVSPTASTLPVTNSVPLSSLPTPSTAPPSTGIVSAPNPPPAGSTTAGFTSQTPPNANPNLTPAAAAPASSVKTPQQIYEELKQLQQQKANPQANPQGSSAPQ